MDNESQNIDFLQSEEWQKFQEAVGKKTHIFSYPQPGPFSAGGGDFDFRASIIEHRLPIVGKYFYVPRGPVIRAASDKRQVASFLNKLTDLAKTNDAGWIRIDPADKKNLELIQKAIAASSAGKPGCKIKKAPHDMQPKEVLAIDIAKSEEELLKEMNSKTRYNVRLAEKKGVKILACDKQHTACDNYIKEFLRLVKLTSQRQGIKSHPENYYRKMLEAIPSEIIKLYVAEYQGKIIVANIMIFFGDTATYLHGASDSEYRNVMAPYLLQWRAIQNAKKEGYVKYDFGGVSSGPTALDHSDLKRSDRYGSWAGITKFKLGFSPNTKTVDFPGSYDIVINPFRYNLYKLLQKIKSTL